MKRVARRTPAERRDTRFLSDGTYAFRDRLQTDAALTANVLTCRAWLIERLEIESGALCFLSGEKKIQAKSSRFWAFYPPFTLSRLSFSKTRAIVTGKAGFERVPAKFASVPIVFESEGSVYDDKIETILATARNVQSIDAYPSASSLSQKARTLIAEVHADEPSIAAIARRLGVSHSHLSRQFRRDYGMAPREYLHQLRIADVTLRLARGESIAAASWDAGYRDLTRFYAQFRKATHTPPAVCREIVAPRRR